MMRFRGRRGHDEQSSADVFGRPARKSSKVTSLPGFRSSQRMTRVNFGPSLTPVGSYRSHSCRYLSIKSRGMMAAGFRGGDTAAQLKFGIRLGERCQLPGFPRRRHRGSIEVRPGGRVSRGVGGVSAAETPRLN